MGFFMGCSGEWIASWGAVPPIHQFNLLRM
jgi:hypothetical protein